MSNLVSLVYNLQYRSILSFHDYAKVTFTIQSYAKSQYYAKATGTPSDPKDTRCVAATSSTSEEIAGLKTNDDGTFTLDRKFYRIKEFVQEEIYLGKLSKIYGMQKGRIRWDITKSRQ